ncbi:unnamed protein product, partial [Nesidiocoris tenuis]
MAFRETAVNGRLFFFFFGGAAGGRTARRPALIERFVSLDHRVSYACSSIPPAEPIARVDRAVRPPLRPAAAPARPARPPPPRHLPPAAPTAGRIDGLPVTSRAPAVGLSPPPRRRAAAPSTGPRRLGLSRLQSPHLRLTSSKPIGTKSTNYSKH